jgi:hypothetical protein
MHRGEKSELQNEMWYHSTSIKYPRLGLSFDHRGKTSACARQLKKYSKFKLELTLYKQNMAIFGLNKKITQKGPLPPGFHSS